MKKLFSTKILVFFLFSFASVYAADLGANKSDWDLYSDRKGDYLGLKKRKMKMIKLKMQSGMPQILKVERPKENKNLAIIHYFAGSAGTSRVVDNYRAVIYDVEKQEFVGEAPLRYESNGEVQKAVWKYSQSGISIEDPFGGSLELKY